MARIVSLSIAAALCFALALAVNPMPYRPGYGLGSFVPDAVVNSLRREADVRSQMLLLSNLDTDAESLAREVQLAATPTQAKGEGFASQHITPPLTQQQANEIIGNITEKRAELWKLKLAAFMNLTEHIKTQVSSLGNASSNATGTGIVNDGSFTTFASNVESAVSWGLSTVANVERAFDSLNVDVEFIRAETNQQDGSYSNHVTAVNKYLEGFARTQPGDTSHVQSAAAKKSQDQMNGFTTNYQVEGTLIVRAFATHRHVLQFNRLAVDTDRLWRAWNYMRPNNRVADPLSQHDAFVTQLKQEQNVDQSTADRINMVSEMFKGSALVGLVHFVNVSATRVNSSYSDVRNGTTQGSFNESNVLSAQDRNYNSSNSSRAREAISRLASMGSNAGLEVHFSLTCVGFIPKLTSNEVQTSVTQMKNFDPATFKIPAIAAGDDTDNALKLVQSNMESVIGATIDSVARVDSASKDKILTASSFMDSFTDYVTASQDPGKSQYVGAPTGLNMRTFSKLDVMAALSNKYLNTGVNLGVDISDDANGQQPSLPPVQPAA